MNVIRQLYQATPHNTAVWDPVAGNDYIIFVASGSTDSQICNGGGTSGIGKMNLQTFQKTCIIAFPYALGNVHITSNNPYGWWGYEIVDDGGTGTANDNSTLAASWQSNWGHLYNEIGVGNISTGAIYRLAHARSRLTGAAPCGGYWPQPRVSMDFSGTWIAFDSSMARTNAPLPACIQDYVDVYVVKFR